MSNLVEHVFKMEIPSDSKGTISLKAILDLGLAHCKCIESFAFEKGFDTLVFWEGGPGIKPAGVSKVKLRLFLRFKMDNRIACLVKNSNQPPFQWLVFFADRYDYWIFFM